MDDPQFQPQPPRLEALESGHSYPRHRHRHGYATIILSGGFEEAGDLGRRIVGAGDVLVHGPFSAHAERAMRATQAINLPLPADRPLESAHGVVTDPDEVVRAAERDPSEALDLLFSLLRPIELPVRDWPDLLAAAIRTGAATDLAEWAHKQGLHPAGLARGFGQLYGIAPARYRRELRACRAWRAIVATAESLAEIAYDCGFADQAHMSRAVGALTGGSPGRWRGLNSFKN